MRVKIARIVLGMLLSLGLTTPTWSQTTAAPKAKTAQTPKKAAGKVDLNKATLEELQELPGIGPVRAAEIIKARPLKSLDDLKSLKGITPAMLTELATKAMVSAPEPLAKPSTKAVTKEATKAVTKEATKEAMPKAAEKSAATKKAAVTKEDDPKQQARKKDALGGKLIDINTASADDLEKLPYIGPVRAAAIIKARPFKTIEDVMKVDGIKEGIFAHIKEHIIAK